MGSARMILRLQGRTRFFHHNCSPAQVIPRISHSRPRLLLRPLPPRIAASSFSTSIEPQFSSGEDATQVRAGMNSLLEQGWKLDADGMGLKKTYYFRSYFKAVSFVNVIAAQSATKKHHPTMTVRIGSVDVHWTTHQPRGLSQKDISMAQHCEEGAELMGAVQESQGKKCSSPAAGN